MVYRSRVATVVEQANSEASPADLRTLTERLTVVETDLAALRERVVRSRSKSRWPEEIVGMFANDPDFDEAARLGRKYRESLREPD